MQASSAEHVVIAEDDEFVQQLLSAYFRTSKFRVSMASTGQELLAVLDREPAAAVLLDLGLPDEDGLVLMRQIRARSAIPIIVLTARRDREDRISALEMGADDYVTKPCDPEELVLRVRNVLARSAAGAQDRRAVAATDRLKFSHWSLDLNARTLHKQSGEEVHLSRTEFNLLAAFAQAPNRVLSRGQLLDAICHNDHPPFERTIDVMVARLRRKIEEDFKKPVLITTMVGLGYRFTAEVSRSAH